MKRGSDSLPDKISGVNGTVLTIPDVLESDQGLYYCIVTNEWGRSVESDNINFTAYGMLTCKYTVPCSTKIKLCTVYLEFGKFSVVAISLYAF